MSRPERSNNARNLFVENSRNKGLARSLHAKQVALAKKIRDYVAADRKGFESWGGMIDDEHVSVFSECDIGVVVDAKMNGIEEVGVGFDESPKGGQRLYQKVGVNTPYYVSVNLYTDRETFDEVQRMHAYDWEERFGLTFEEVKESTKDVISGEDLESATFKGGVVGDPYWTYFFTDEEGNYAKVVGIPEQLARGRKDLLIEGHKIDGTISVQIPMLARDFILMGNCLDGLDKGVDRMIQGPQ